MIIIFDLDGTLLNTIDDLGHACNYALEKTGHPTFPIEAYPAKVGNGINNLIRRALPESERTEENILRVREFFVPYYNEHNCDYTHPYTGVPEVLAVLKAQGHLLAVASNKYQAAPNPKIVFDILDRCAVRGETTDVVRSEILYVGDSLVDYETAKNANVPFVACSWGFVSRERLVTAEIATIVDTPKDILKLKDVLAII